MPQYLEDMIRETMRIIQPQEHLTVTEAAEKYRRVNNPGSYVGPWKRDLTPYLQEPMDVLTSLEHTGMIFVGPAQTGKALALETLLPTPEGFTTMRDVRVGDKLVGSAGVCTVTATSSVMRNHKCYLVEFSNGERVVADAGHKWSTKSYRDGRGGYRVRTTQELFDDGGKWVVPLAKFTGGDIPLPLDPYPLGGGLGDGSSYRPDICGAPGDLLKTRPLRQEQVTIVSITETQSVPVKCVAVDSPDHLYAFGATFILTHNTDMVLNWLNHTALCDPADMTIIAPTMESARDFSLRRIDRFLRGSPKVMEAVAKGGHNKNVFDLRFTNGMLTTLTWPTVANLAGKPIPRLWIFDYDRIDDDIGGEGSAYNLAEKRATTFRQFGMAAAESSPSREVDRVKWIPQSPHEAPPTKGILQLYNLGDRRRWYWVCYACGHAYEPDFPLIQYPDSKDIEEAAAAAELGCPHCGALVANEPKASAPGRYEMNQKGVWVPDGMTWSVEAKRLIGAPRKSRIASFWLKGPAAGFTDFSDLVRKYLSAMETYERTGDQEPLKTTVNTDQGLPFIPMGVNDGLLPEKLKDSAAHIPQAVVPIGVRYLLAAIDVQKSKFVVQVIGIRSNGDYCFVDRFDIKKSKRLDEDGERYPITPGAYPEDWHHLVDEVILKQYPLQGAPDKVMHVKATICDSGGREGVTKNAYDFWRWLRNNKEVPGLHRRFHLLKGSPRQSAPLTDETFPESERKDRSAGARGEIPVLLINSNRVKDAVHKMLLREDEGGRVVFAGWLKDEVYEELTVEIRTLKGWENPKKQHNEAWDLLCYVYALNISKYVRGDFIKWHEGPVPLWAEEWENNSLVAQVGDAKFSLKRAPAPDFTKHGKALT